jgi:hypothetical protein
MEPESAQLVFPLPFDSSEFFFPPSCLNKKFFFGAIQPELAVLVLDDDLEAHAA